MYRYSTWVRRKTIGNGQTYLGVNGYVGAANYGVLNKSNLSISTNPYFLAANWWGVANDWYLVVGHVWPFDSVAGSAHVDTGIYTAAGVKVLGLIDFVWQDRENQISNQKAYLFYSTDTTTNQQFYDPRVDVIDGTAPSIEDLLYNSSSKLSARLGQDVCSKSLSACIMRNNSLHYGGFPGVGRSIPRV